MRLIEGAGHAYYAVALGGGQYATLASDPTSNVVCYDARVRLSGSGKELLANQEVRAAYLEGGHA